MRYRTDTASHNVIAHDPGQLTALREQKFGRSIESFASFASVDSRTIRRAERGDPIWGVNAIAIAAALKRTVESLFTVAVELNVQLPRTTERTISSGVHYAEPVTRFSEHNDSIIQLNRNASLLSSRESMFVPVEISEIAEMAGRLRRIEVPQAVLREVMSNRPDLVSDFQVYKFLHDCWSSHPEKHKSTILRFPTALDWIQSIWKPASVESAAQERMQLKRFFSVMNNFVDSGMLISPGLPGFLYDEVSCWRVFVQLFPTAIQLLEAASMNRELPDDKAMALSLLSSTVALTDEKLLSQRARSISSRLRDRVRGHKAMNKKQYRMIRQLLYSAVEAGVYASDEMLVFLQTSKDYLRWELEMLRDYYKDKSDKTLACSIIKKCGQPLVRDENTLPISHFHRNLLHRDLVTQAENLIQTEMFRRGPVLEHAGLGNEE
jgi:hypothetical protein